MAVNIRARVREFLVLGVMGAIGAAPYGSATAQERPNRGKVVYEGSYKGKQTEGLVLFGKGPELIGAITLTVTFDGNAVRATYKTTGRLSGGTASGVVEGDVCKLFGSGNLTIEADCTGQRFAGKLFQQPRSELRREVTFDLVRRTDSVAVDRTEARAADSPVNAEIAASSVPVPLATATGDALPDIASVAYQGVYSGTQYASSRSRTSEREMSGAVSAVLKFDGPAVIAEFQTTGTIRSFKLTGSREGTLCKLFGPRGMSLVGTCNATGLDALLRSSPDARDQLSVRFQAKTTKLTDVEQQRESAALERARLERERAEERAKREAEQAAAAEARKREEAAEAARLEQLLQNLPPARK